VDFKNVEGSHHRSGSDGKFSDRQFGPVVHAVDRFNGVSIQYPFRDHQPRTTLVLLRRLKDEINRSREIPRLGEVFGCPKQHCGMAVVAACVHPSGIFGSVWEIVALLDRQRVHVGAQCNCATARRRSVECSDHAGSGKAALDCDAKGLEQLRNQLRGPVFLEGDLGTGMNTPTPFGHLGMKFGDPIDDRHQPFLSGCSVDPPQPARQADFLSMVPAAKHPSVTQSPLTANPRGLPTATTTSAYTGSATVTRSRAGRLS
jgi:hypothetical protein